jgi:hypothetical protein
MKIFLITPCYRDIKKNSWNDIHGNIHESNWINVRTKCNDKTKLFIVRISVFLLTGEGHGSEERRLTDLNRSRI